MPAVLSRLAAPSARSSSASLTSLNSVGNVLYLLTLLIIATVLLEKGCTYTLDNISQIALVARVDQTLISLITAGGEWEELAVVIAAVRQRRSALALGNIVGAAISNILGAFSLGLIFAPKSNLTESEGNNTEGTLPAGFRYADVDPDTGLAVVRVDSLNPDGTTITRRPDKGGFYFDRSAKTYATLQFLITSIVAPLLYFAQASAEHYGPIQPPLVPNTGKDRWRRTYVEWSPTAIRILAVVLIVLFALYMLSIGVAIYQGWIAPPPDSSDDENSSSSSTSSDSDSDVEGRAARRRTRTPDQHRPRGFLASVWARRFWARHGGPAESALINPDRSTTPAYGATPSSSADPAEQSEEVSAHTQRRRRRVRADDDSSPITHWLFRRYPQSRLYLSVLPRFALSLLGLLLLAISGTMLSSVGSTLASLWGWSDTLFGLTLLSFLTTVPEKALSAVAGRKGLAGALAGASAGSNIFLLSLCAGVALLGLANERSIGIQDHLSGAEIRIPLLKWEEIALLWVSSLVLCLIVCLTGGRRWHGWVLLAAYIAYLVAELTVWKR